MSAHGAREHQGRTSFSENEIVIEIAPADSDDLRENLIAHELFHIVLVEKGFPYATWVPKGLPDTGLLLEIGEGITACVNDAVIDKLMTDSGFRPELLSGVEATNYHKLHGFPESLLRNPMFVKKAALRLFCLSQKRSDFEMQRVEDAFRNLNPDIVETSRGLSAKVGDIKCETVAECKEVMKRLRDAVGLPIKIVDFSLQRLE